MHLNKENENVLKEVILLRIVQLWRMENFEPKVSDQFQEIVEGIDIPCNLQVPEQPPDWLDKEAFCRGQQYFRENRVSVILGCLRNLVAGLLIQNLW